MPDTREFNLGTTEQSANARTSPSSWPVEPHETLDQHGQLVAGAPGLGGEPPLMNQSRVAEQPEHRLGVADVGGEEHDPPPFATRNRARCPPAGRPP